MPITHSILENESHETKNPGTCKKSLLAYTGREDEAIFKNMIPQSSIKYGVEEEERNSVR